MGLVTALLVAALLAALATVAGRSLRRGRARSEREREKRERPGLSAEHPLAVTSYLEIDDAVELTRCPCGGLLDRIGEGSRTGPRGAVRVVRCTCLTCEEDLDLFFDLSGLRH